MQKSDFALQSEKKNPLFALKIAMHHTLFMKMIDDLENLIKITHTSCLIKNKSVHHITLRIINHDNNKF